MNNFRVSLGSEYSTEKSLKRVDELIDVLTSKQAQLGAIANRLESSLEITENNKINWNSAISTIKDADIALESMNLVNAQILRQVSTALFASSRQNKSIALSLIRQAVY